MKRHALVEKVKAVVPMSTSFVGKRQARPARHDVKKQTILATVVALGLSALPCRLAADGLPDFVPDAGLSGTIRISGSPDDAGLIAAWEKGFKVHSPGVRFEPHLSGPDSTMAWLYTGKADIALLERELKAPVEHMAFTWVYQYPEFVVSVATVGATTNRLGAAIAVFVNKDNPISSLTMQQLDSLYGADFRRGGTSVSTWGDLGLTGTWTGEKVHVYGPDLDSAWALSLRHAVLQGSYKWSAAYREVPGREADVLRALAEDRAGVAYGPLSAANDRVKAVALAPQTGGTPVALTPDNLKEGRYPLRRFVSMVLNRAPDKPIELRLQSFLRYVLSREGQAAITADGAYLPLDETSITKQRARLD